MKSMDIALVLANLAIRPDRRKLGYAKLLLRSCAAIAEVLRSPLLKGCTHDVVCQLGLGVQRALLAC